MNFLTRLWSILRNGRHLGGPAYHHFRRIILPSLQGTTEIDHLIVSKFGIFVVELKDRSGWIYANAFDPYWRAVHFGTKYWFQNPLHQNYGHVKAVEAFLGVDSRVMRSIVVFRGSFEFKTRVPAGVLCHSYESWIASAKEVLLDDATVDRIVTMVRTKAKRGWRAGRRHARSVRARFASDTLCPKCGGQLRLRMQRYGSEPGSQFFGCSRYPRCRYTRDA